MFTSAGVGQSAQLFFGSFIIGFLEKEGKDLKKYVKKILQKRKDPLLIVKCSQGVGPVGPGPPRNPRLQKKKKRGILNN